MKTVQITEDAVKKAHNEASNKGKTLLENLFGDSVFQKDIKERVKSIDDAIKVLGESDPDVIDYRKLFDAGISDHIFANQSLVVITKALNEGWEPDWHNDEWDKWFNWFNMSSSSSGRFSFYYSVNRYSISTVGSRLCFKSKELAQYAAKQFIEIYNKAFTI
jgi:hypothetical protein